MSKNEKDIDIINKFNTWSKDIPLLIFQWVMVHTETPIRKEKLHV